MSLNYRRRTYISCSRLPVDRDNNIFTIGTKPDLKT